MICQQCGMKHAVTKIKTSVNGVVSEYSLCADCAARMGFTMGADNHFTGFGSLLGSLFGLEEAPEAVVRCPVCNSSFGDISKSGKAGCAECYKVFRAKLMPTVVRLHGNTKHCGKNPIGTALQVIPESKLTVAEPKKEVSQIEALKAQMTEAVSKQNFEEAAVIRDKIKALEAEGGEGNE